MQNEDEITIKQSKESISGYAEAETALQELVLKAFLPIVNVEKKTLKERLLTWTKEKYVSCYGFFSSSSKEEQNPTLPLIQPINQDKNTNSFSWGYSLTILLCTGIGIYSGFMYWNTSKSASELLSEQIESLEWLQKMLGSEASYVGEIIAELSKYCAVETNSVLNTQVMIIMATMIHRLLNRSEAEKFLTGNVNYKPWVAGGLTAVGGAIPFASLDLETATNIQEKIMAYFASMASLPPYWFGSQSLLSHFFPNVFSETIDNSAKNFNKSEQLALRKARNILSGKMCDKVNVVLFEYMQGKTTTLSQFTDQFKILNQSKSKENLTALIALMRFSDEEEPKIRANQVVEKVKLISKGTASIGISIVVLASLINDTLTAYYAGHDLTDSKVGQIMLGGLTAALSGVSITGFTLVSLKSIIEKIWNREYNVIKTINPKIFYPLAIVLTIGGIFSGGAGAYAGFSKVSRLLSDLGYKELSKWLPEVFEGIGYAGNALVNVPYCLGWAQWLLGMYAEHCRDQQVKTIMYFTGACHKLSEVVRSTKIMHIKSLLEGEVFGDHSTLEIMGMGEDITNVLSPNNSTIQQLS